MCVLYTNQTKETRSFVLKILHENVNTLIHTASGVSFTPREKLARVHALLVYQTIRMFDGDISLGQQAEKDQPILEAWNEELGKFRDNLDDVAQLDMEAVRQRQPESWEVSFKKKMLHYGILPLTVFSVGCSQKVLGGPILYASL